MSVIEKNVQKKGEQKKLYKTCKLTIERTTRRKTLKEKSKNMFKTKEDQKQIF